MTTQQLQMTTSRMPKTKGLRKEGGGAKLLKADGAEGVVTVAFAQLNVVDHDGDITMPGAFQSGQQLKVCQTGHAHYSRVAGAGEITGEQGDDAGNTWAVAELKYFLDTDAGREEYATVKALHDSGHSQEWSYGYDILEAEATTVDGQTAQALKSLSVYEISPVLRGAGIGTHTSSVKGEKCEACGQPLVKTVEVDPVEACADCDEPPSDCTCDAKGRTEQALIQFELTRARVLGVRID